VTVDRLADLTACAARDLLANGDLGARAYAEALIAVVEAREPVVRGWAHFDAAAVRDAADALDASFARGGPVGPLHGLPVGIKDIIDTADMPTANGCAADRGRQPGRDAEVVARLRAAGAIVMGKTVTTELAYLRPSATRNPVNPAHTPGGSSAGSAATVAAGMVPLAIGTQTAGSVIRPAAFCGIIGFKPTFGAIPREGVLSQSPSLDTVGVFAHTPGDAALMADVLMGRDPVPMVPMDRPPVFGFCRPPGWEECTTGETRAALTALAADLGALTVDLPEGFGEIAALRALINTFEMARAYARYEGSALGPETRAGIEAGKAVSEAEYRTALARQARLQGDARALFGEVDAFLTPAAPGPAPEGLGSTGDSVFNGLWTFLGTPAVTIPLLRAGNGLPLGVQLVGPPGGDGDLMRAARWLFERDA